jgi:hypothetical protein
MSTSELPISARLRLGVRKASPFSGAIKPGAEGMAIVGMGSIMGAFFRPGAGLLLASSRRVGSGSLGCWRRRAI